MNRAVAKVARLIILTDPPQRGICAQHPVSWNRIDWNIRLGRGHQLKPTQGEGPARASTVLGATIDDSFIRLQELYMNTHSSRIQGLSGLIDHRVHSPTSYFRFSRHPTTIHAGSREPTQQGYYLSEVCQIEGAETPKPRQRTGLKSIGLTDLFT